MTQSIQSRLRKKRPPAPSLQAAATEKARGNARERGYDIEWQKLRARYLAAHPFCECETCRRSMAPAKADTVDHIVPHRGDDRLRLDPANLQAMSHAHHSRKTARFDGGFGNRKYNSDK